MNENIADEIRKTIESIKDMKTQVGGINNYLSILEGMARADHKKQVDEAYQRGYKACMSENDFDAPCTSCDAYQRGLEEGKKTTWEAVRKVIRLPEGVVLDLFTDCYSSVCTVLQVFLKYEESEVIAKLKAYEEKQKTADEIKVGDEVERYIINGKLDSKGIYLGDTDEEGDYWNCLFWTGAVFTVLAYPKRQFKRTGRHFDIDKILEEMRHD